jgi:hypothetical protein
MSTTQVSLKVINEYIINGFIVLFKNHKSLYKLYLESCYKKCNNDKLMWLRGFITTVTKHFDKHILYERFYGKFHKKYPNYAIDGTQYNDISYFIADCIENDDDHEYYELFDDEEHEEDDQLLYEYIDDSILQHYDNHEYDTQYILFTYFNHYLTYKLDCIIFRIDDMISKNIIKKTQIRDAKLAIIVLNKIPNLNYDVISHIAKYICRDIKI